MLRFCVLRLIDMIMKTNITKPIRVILAHDHPIVRAGIREALQEIPGVEVVGEASDGREAIALVKTHQPDVVFMDISMPGLNGLEATKRIVNAFPQVRVIILSRHENEEYYWRGLQLGASGYVLKKGAIAELKAALQTVVGGEIYVSREISTRLRSQLPLQRIARGRSPVEQLTTRQREILQLIAEGQTAKAIALYPENKRQDCGIPSRKADGRLEDIRHPGTGAFRHADRADFTGTLTTGASIPPLPRCGRVAGVLGFFQAPRICGLYPFRFSLPRSPKWKLMLSVPGSSPRGCTSGLIQKRTDPSSTPEDHCEHHAKCMAAGFGSKRP